MNISITGSTGFVGQNLIGYLKYHQKQIQRISRQSLFEDNFTFNEKTDVVIHLSGKAHDLKKASFSCEYYKVNTDLTKKVFDAFLLSDSKVFITLSSVKAVADEVKGELTENEIPRPVTDYGKSKLLAEQYILANIIPVDKRVYILRPCMIHGPGNKGNLNILYNLVSKGFPWPLGKYKNSRSYLSIDNLCFIIKELIENENIPSGVYNVADDVPLSTNEVIKLIAESKKKQSRILKISKPIITSIARIGDFLKLPLNSERLEKLTESYVVVNTKIKAAIGKPLPVSSKLGLLKTFQSFSSNA
jgi:nucleoside-diphosphate-sugar epimerase